MRIYSGNLHHMKLGAELVMPHYHDFKHKVVFAYEDKDKTGQPVDPHIHFVIECDDSETTVRDYLKSFFNIPKTGKGKKQLYSIKQVDDIDSAMLYTCKWGNILYHKYCEIYIKDMILRGREIHIKDAPQPGSSMAVEEPQRGTAAEKLSEFDMLYHAYILHKSHHKDIDDSMWTMRYIKQFIKSHYLKRGRPIPRSGDTNRYAYSIYAIANDKTGITDMDDTDKHAQFYDITF